MANIFVVVHVKGSYLFIPVIIIVCAIFHSNLFLIPPFLLDYETSIGRMNYKKKQLGKTPLISHLSGTFKSVTQSISYFPECRHSPPASP